MYYIIKTSRCEVIGLQDVDFYNADIYEKEEYKFNHIETGKLKFMIQTCDVDYIVGTDDEEEWRTLLIKLEQGDDYVHSF